jgi:DNA-binding transcriptional regulator YiaG
MYQSEQLMVVHDIVKSLYKIGAIDNAKMREFDNDCLVQEREREPETACKHAEIRHISPIAVDI